MGVFGGRKVRRKTASDIVSLRLSMLNVAVEDLFRSDLRETIGYHTEYNRKHDDDQAEQ